MKNYLPLALTVLVLGGAPAMAADVNANVGVPGVDTGVNVNTELNKDKAQLKTETQAEIGTDADAKTDIETKADTETEHNAQAGLKTETEVEAQADVTPDPTASHDAEHPTADVTTGGKADVQTEASTSSSKNVQKLFSMFHKQNAPQTEANAKTDLNVETKTNTELK